MQRRIALILTGITILITTGVFYAKSAIHKMWQEPTPSLAAFHRNTNGGAIEGRVLNSDGEPVARAKVSAENENSMGRVISSQSDKDGYYRIETEPGTYMVVGSKEEDGYALTISGFHQEGNINIPKVTVGPNQVIQGIDVNLGSRASILEVVITEAVSNRPINKARIKLRRADNPEILYSIGTAAEKKNGKFKVLVPHVPFTIEISSPDYETWTYSADGSGKSSDALVLNPGENKKLTVVLRHKN